MTAELKRLWDNGIGQWCEQVGGILSRSKMQPWIKTCDLPGDHHIIFWNSGDEEKDPKEIAVRFFPKDGGDISIGDLEKISGDCIETRDELHIRSHFARSERRGFFCKKDEKHWRLAVDIHHETEHYSARIGKNEFPLSYAHNETFDKLINDFTDIQLRHTGGMSGSLYSFDIEFASGPRPRKDREPKDDTMMLTPAPYSALLKIDEAAWEHEFKAKPDAIDFSVEGSKTYTTLKELKDMGVKHVRIRFPSGRVEEYDLDVLLRGE